jgi:hypothetical protein
MRLKSIIEMFEKGNVLVYGVKGSGKDMLFGNVVVRRKKPYMSTVDYGGKFIPWDYAKIELAGNTYRNFISGKLKRFVCPLPDGTDVYVPDVGVMFPAQYCNEINRDYKSFGSYLALSRHLHLGAFHCNTQAIRRPYDKIREQADQYILCIECKVFGGWVYQKIRIYELYESADRKIPPFRLPRPWFNADRKQRWMMEKERYEQTYGYVRECVLFYRNRSKYDTRIFKTMLEKGVVENEQTK